MAAAKKAETPPPQPPEPPRQTEALYPAIEALVETATAADLEALFEDLRLGLGTLKGPKTGLGKKVGQAIARTEELLSYLLQVREKLEADRQGRP